MDALKLMAYRQACGDEAQALACHAKRRYPSAAKARQKAIRMQWRFGKQRAYECPVCGGWHLTSQSDDNCFT